VTVSAHATKDAVATAASRSGDDASRGTGDQAGRPAASRSAGTWIAAWRRQARNPYFAVGLAIYVLFAVVAVFADAIAQAPFDILFLPDGKLAAALPPSAGHLLGTTTAGRDIFTQLVHGTRSALTVGVSAAFVVVVLGTVVGLLSGYFGGLVDAILMRIADIALGLPLLPFVIVLTAFLGPSTWNVVLAMTLLLWPNTARIIRSQVLTVRERAYVEAARVTGSGHARILFLHIAPNILPLSFLFGSIAIGWAIMIEASISFLGFGDPETVSWGFMLQDAYVSQALSRGLFHWFIPPGICIILIVSAGFFISRSYEKFLFPRLRDQRT
jgi:peptide/nickel transport system permease protein